MNIVFISCTENYPNSFSANNTKIEYLSRGLIEQGHSVCIIGRINGSTSIENDLNIKSKYGANCFLFTQKGNKIITALKNLYKQLSLLKKIGKKQEENILILDVGFFMTLVIYKICAILFNYKIVHIITEWHEQKKDLWHKNLNIYIYLHLFGYFVDAILPISNSILQHIAHFKKPMLKIPILSEYKPLNNQDASNNQIQFTYCANGGYIRIVSFVLSAMKIVNSHYPKAKLTLILYGREDAINKIRNNIKISGQEQNVEILQDVSQEILFNIYKNSIGLLIPLDPNSIQDQNRFSQKIAEYISTGRPIITSPVGEVKYYFKNIENAIFAKEFKEESYAEAILWVINNPEKARIIGIKGYELGVENFNYKKMAQDMERFISNLIS